MDVKDESDKVGLSLMTFVAHLVIIGPLSACLGSPREITYVVR